MTIAPTKDYCTGWFEGTWAHCCHAHDIAYGMGLDKLTSDINLMKCVIDSAPKGLGLLYVLIGAIMFIGVSLLGNIFWRNKR